MEWIRVEELEGKEVYLRILNFQNEGNLQVVWFIDCFFSSMF